MTVAYLAVLCRVDELRAGNDAADAALVPVAEVLSSDRRPLAFDHEQILRDAVAHLGDELGAHVAGPPPSSGPEFTLELRTV